VKYANTGGSNTLILFSSLTRWFFGVFFSIIFLKKGFGIEAMDSGL
jgi:hypothetical protein